MHTKRNTPEGDRLNIPVSLVEAYEREHSPMDLPDPVEATKFVMEQQDLTMKDLEPAIGRANRIYEVFIRPRTWTLAMIRKLHKRFGIRAEVLIADCG